MKSFKDINWADEADAREVYDALRAGGTDSVQALRITESECVQIIPFNIPVKCVVHHAVKS